MTTLTELAQSLAAGATSSRRLAEDALARIDQQTSAGVPAFIHVNAERVKADADASDARRKAGRLLSDFDGIPYAVKDLFDVAGEVTTAGSVVLKASAPAKQDSEAVSRLRAEGFVPLGRTNMTEFAYSGLGLNPHYGTPPAVTGAADLRIPGGSSSGTAVAIADGVCSFGLGTDTGGSCRIPAAFNGVTGFKPTARRVSKRGAFPLSDSFDSVGPLGMSADCCAALDDIIADQPRAQRALKSPIRLAVLSNYVLDGVSPPVAADYTKALARLSGPRFELSEVRFDPLDRLPSLLVNGGIVAYEASRAHASRMSTFGHEYDPRVMSRIKLGFETSNDAYDSLLRERAAMISAFERFMQDYDAVICPTVAIETPRIADCAEVAEYRRINGMVLRNTYVFNFLDGCSGSIPMHAKGALPTGMMVSGPAMADSVVFYVMSAIESVLAERAPNP
jgi:aspartyl-tRNA(Asn)/glutamyl-tRNA(Gln) amidotransferase subunit A